MTTSISLPNRTQANTFSGCSREIQFIHTLCLFCVEFVGAERYKITFSNSGVLLMAKRAKKRRAWTPEHLRTLKTLARKKTKAAKIAKTLKRTEGATRQKAFSMGLSLDTRA